MCSAEKVREINGLAAQFVAGRSVLFTARIEGRRIADGHGDLLADDIVCLPGGVEILDCLEFDDELRYVDAIDDAAFLAMDLEFLGAKDRAGFFQDRYIRLSGDPALAPLPTSVSPTARLSGPRWTASGSGRAMQTRLVTRPGISTSRSSTCSPAPCGCCSSAAGLAPGRRPWASVSRAGWRKRS